VRIAIYAGLWLIVSSYAILMGGKLERAGTAIMLWLSAGIFFVRPFVDFSIFSLDISSLIVDLIGLAGLLYLALTTDRNWPLWACSAQVIAVTGHLVRVVQSGEAPLAYAAMIRAPAYIQLIALLVGTIAAQRSRAKRDSITSWRI